MEENINKAIKDLQDFGLLSKMTDFDKKCLLITLERLFISGERNGIKELQDMNCIKTRQSNLA